MIAPLLAALALTTTASAHELALEVGTHGAPDDDYELFSEQAAVAHWGARGAVSLGDRWSVLGTWNTAREGLDVFNSNGSYAFATSFTHNRVGLGPRFELELLPWLSPYAALQGVAWFGTVRLDEAPEVDNNPGETTFRGLTFGGQASLGLLVEPVQVGRLGKLAFYGELGFGQTGRMRFEDEDNRDIEANGPVELGNVYFQGLTSAAGVAFRF